MRHPLSLAILGIASLHVGMPGCSLWTSIDAWGLTSVNAAGVASTAAITLQVGGR